MPAPRMPHDRTDGPPLDEATVVAFEVEHGVRLPEPYRSFVVSAANGASGPPHYGLVPVGEPTQGGGHRIEPGSLREPFPLSEPWIWEGSAFPDTASIERVHRFGTLPLGTDGDGMDYVLVVTGDARGQVWMITGEGAVPVASDFGMWLAGDVFPEATWTLDARICTGHPRP